MNLDEKLKQHPEAQRIVNLAFQNSKKDASGRKHGELTKKELLSYTKAIEKAQSARIRELEGAIEGLLEQHNIRLDLDVSGELPGWAITRCEKALNKKEPSDGSVIRG